MVCMVVELALFVCRWMVAVFSGRCAMHLQQAERSPEPVADDAFGHQCEEPSDHAASEIDHAHDAAVGCHMTLTNMPYGACDADDCERNEQVNGREAAPVPAIHIANEERSACGAEHADNEDVTCSAVPAWANGGWSGGGEARPERQAAAQQRKRSEKGVCGNQRRHGPTPFVIRRYGDRDDWMFGVRGVCCQHHATECVNQDVKCADVV
ncbi:hypothetical protein SDC9_96111 [bioreactor metagenome]|uniref:Uncharacterized protein n=1 Tax=bioreactor metagenome TaxID=1076179 RepID=A0A645A8D5_9ZZZZ